MLGSQLRTLRERAKLSQTAAAAAVDIDRSTLNRVEQGARPAQRRTLAALLNLYAAPEQLRSQLLSRLAQAEEPGWMRPLRGLLPEPYGAYIHLEREARVIQWYEPLLIPGLLQTSDYARAHAQALPG